MSTRDYTYTQNTTWEDVPVDAYLRATTYGVTELVRRAKDGRGYRSLFWGEPGQSWDLGLGIDRTLEMAREGWRGKGEYIQRLADKCAELALEMPTQQIVRDVRGPLWDMPAVIEGQPYCAYNFVDAPEAQLIKLVINGFYSASVNAEALERRAAAIAALVLTLHTAGFALECSIIRPSSTGYTKIMTEVVIHTPGDVFDLERLAFWMGHPASVRNLLYAAQGTFENDLSCMPYDALVTAIKRKADLEGAIYIDSMYSGFGGQQDSISACATEEGAMKWIRQQVDKTKKWALSQSEGPQIQGVT